MRRLQTGTQHLVPSLLVLLVQKYKYCSTLTRLLHASHTPLTRLLASYTPLTRLLHASHTPLTRLLASYTPYATTVPYYGGGRMTGANYSY
jgi:ABC-type transporter Mla subunit MlaD